MKELSTNWALWGGLVQGLQANPDNYDHECAVSFNTFKSAKISMNSFQGNYDDALTNNFADFGSYVKLAKRGVEQGVLFYEVYE